MTHQASASSLDVAARAFVSSYVSFLYGRRAAASVNPIGRGLRQRILGAQSTATPAELARAIVVRDLTVNRGPSVTAVAHAVVDDGTSPPYAFSFNLTLSHGRWLIDAVQGSDQ